MQSDRARVEFGHIYGAQTGGGVCIDFQNKNGGAGGGTNHVLAGSCNFFPIALRSLDHHGNVISFKAENTANVATEPNVMGSTGSGIGILLDAAGTNTCYQNRLLSPGLSQFATAIEITAHCQGAPGGGAPSSGNLIVAPEYDQNTTNLFDGTTSDLVFNTDGVTLGAQALFNITPAVSGSANIAGTITTTAGSGTSSSLGYQSQPLCIVTPQSSANGFTAFSVLPVGPLPTWTLSVSTSVTNKSFTFNYICFGSPKIDEF